MPLSSWKRICSRRWQRDHGKGGIRCVPVRVGIVGRTDWEVSPERVLEAGSALEAFGKKTANALLGAAKAVRSGKIGMERLAALPDDEAVGALCSLRCVDVRLAVRVLIGVLRRPDVLRFDDEAVRSG